MDPISAISNLVSSLLNKFVPDKSDVIKQETDQLHQQISVLVAEAQSQDKWTSRARPSFLYVMYIMILMAIPMSFVSVISPSTARAIATGLQDWLAAIPDSMWTLFGTGYVGYVAGRSWDKTQILKGKK
ncbi:MAG TPA: holin family protein [Rummeliibacillus sp.]|nr:holin family protein [Rummeliibacillus sp.]